MRNTAPGRKSVGGWRWGFRRPPPAAAAGDQTCCDCDFAINIQQTALFARLTWALFLIVCFSPTCSTYARQQKHTMAHSAHFCKDVKREATSSKHTEAEGFASSKVNHGLRHSGAGGPGIVVGVGADDVPEGERGPGTEYLLNNVLWGLRDDGFEKQAWSGAKFPCPSCGKCMR